MSHWHIYVGSSKGEVFHKLTYVDALTSVKNVMGLCEALGARPRLGNAKLLEIEADLYAVVDNKDNATGYLVNFDPFRLMWTYCEGCHDPFVN